MSLARNLFCSSLGKKYLMALTGLVLIGFVTGHLVGNLQIFSPADKINGYAHFLQGLGPVLWIVRLALLATVGLHIWAAVSLTLANNKAKPVKYAVEVNNAATAASRYMRLSGLVVLAFIIYHLAHFTLGAAGSETFKTKLPEYTMTSDFHLLGITIVPMGTQVHDVHSMVVLGFCNPIVSGFYILAIGLLSFHLVHGVGSMWQSLGLRTRGWDAVLKPVTLGFAVLYFLGNLAIPVAVLTKVVKTAPGPNGELPACCAPKVAPAADAKPAHD